MGNLIPLVKRIEHCILQIRGQKIILDADIAKLYGVTTKALVQAVRRNFERFPEDFIFRLTPEESENLRSQFVTSSWGGRRYTPFAFTEQGVAMLSSVLRSKRAIRVNIEIMRIFVRIRRMLETNKQLKQKLEELEKKYDRQFKVVFDAIHQLMVVSEKKKNRIGFI